METWAPPDNDPKLTAENKALRINLDPKIYGTFAEIGAGQEVARYFFRVGGASGTIAKTMSAYDMTFSDEIYGRSGRYVSLERLQSMLHHEYQLLLQRLSGKRGADTTFFIFANTVAARNYEGTNEAHGWMGVRLQTEPLGPPNDVIMHVRMTDRENVLQQQALGIIGVNLLYGAFFYSKDPDQFVEGLLHELSIDRIEVDMIELRGPAMQGIDNRVMSLKLVNKGLTNAVMFAPDRTVLQPSEILHKHPILVCRGSFSPVTYVNVDMMNCARMQFNADPAVREKDAVPLFEITLHNLMNDGRVDDSDFIARADTLSSLGYSVLISNYSEHYRLTGYFRRYTNEIISMAMGIDTLLNIFNEKFYENLEGGMLEALGRLFRKQLQLYIYPMLREDYITFVRLTGQGHLPDDPGSLPPVITARDVHILPHLRHLYKYLFEIGNIVPIEGVNEGYLPISSRDILQMIRKGDPEWEKAVPPSAAALIKQRGIFGFKQ